DDDDDRELARAPVEIATGTSAEVTLVLPPRIRPPERAPLSGTIQIADGWAGGAWRLHVRPMFQSDADAITVEQSDWTPIDGEPGRWRFTARDVEPGRWLLALFSMAAEREFPCEYATQIVDVPAGGASDAARAVRPPAIVEIAVRERGSGRSLPASDVGIVFFLPHASAGTSPLLAADGDRLVATLPSGRLDLNFSLGRSGLR